MSLELVHFFVSKLVDKPDLVTVKQIAIEGKNVIEVRVSSHDLPRVIGKEGRTFKAIKLLVNSISKDLYQDVVIDIV